MRHSLIIIHEQTINISQAYDNILMSMFGLRLLSICQSEAETHNSYKS
jgi:hypothetical protein